MERDGRIIGKLMVSFIIIASIIIGIYAYFDNCAYGSGCEIGREKVMNLLYPVKVIHFAVSLVYLVVIFYFIAKHR